MNFDFFFPLELNNWIDLLSVLKQISGGSKCRKCLRNAVSTALHSGKANDVSEVHSLYPKEMILKAIQALQMTARAKQNARKKLFKKESWEL